MATITVEKETYRHLKEESKRTGVNEKELIDRALAFYLANRDAVKALRFEFDAWEALSDEVWKKEKFGS